MTTLVSKCYEGEWDFVFTVKTDNAGVSNPDQFTLPLVSGQTYDFKVNWGDGTSDSITTSTSPTHTYAIPGTYKIRVRGLFPRIYFNNGGDVDKIININNLGVVGWNNFRGSFFGADNLLTIERAGNTSNVVDFSLAWEGCVSLTSIPLIDTSNAATLLRTFNNCNSLTATPSLNTSNVIDFVATFRNNYSLSLFSFIDVSKGTTFNQCWLNNYVLANFPANLFDTWVGVPVNQCFRYTWDNCNALTSQSVENILVSIDTSGVNAPGGATAGDNYIEIDYNVSTGGLTATTNTAITNLKGKGWEPFINGVLV